MEDPDGGAGVLAGGRSPGAVLLAEDPGTGPHQSGGGGNRSKY